MDNQNSPLKKSSRWNWSKKYNRDGCQKLIVGRTVTLTAAKQKRRKRSTNHIAVTSSLQITIYSANAFQKRKMVSKALKYRVRNPLKIIMQIKMLGHILERMNRR